MYTGSSATSGVPFWNRWIGHSGVIQSHPYCCRQKSRTECSRNAHCWPFSETYEDKQRENTNFVDFIHLTPVQRLIRKKLQLFPTPLLFRAPFPDVPFGSSRWSLPQGNYSHGAILYSADRMIVAWVIWTQCQRVTWRTDRLASRPYSALHSICTVTNPSHSFWEWTATSVHSMMSWRFLGLLVNEAARKSR